MGMRDGLLLESSLRHFLFLSIFLLLFVRDSWAAVETVPWPVALGL